MVDIAKARQWVLDLLESGLSPLLTYHSLKHTRWVVESCLTIAQNEGIDNPQKLIILETAAWFHDAGFTRVYLKHEETGCTIAREVLPDFGGEPAEIDKICELIMATKVPQNPACKLAEILCDADLDYLGRDDFQEWSDNLKKEWLSLGIITNPDDFYGKQIKFLQIHKYHTKDAQTRREPVKQKILSELLANGQ